MTQCPSIAQGGIARPVGPFLILEIGRNTNGEPRTAAKGAVDRDAAAHHPAKALAERQSQTRAAIFGCGRSFGLIEVLEQFLNVVGGDSDSIVLDADANPVAGGAALSRHV